MNYAALSFWVLIAWSVTASRGVLLLLLIASMPFTSLALIPPEIIGMSILPQSMFAVVLIVKVITPQLMTLSPNLLTALRLRHLGVLALFLLTGAVATIIMPKLFVEEVVVYPMKQVSGADLLRPTLQNFTQLSYVSLSVMTVFAVTLMAAEPRFRETLLAGVLTGGLVCIGTGLIDFAAASAGAESLLEPFRNADYALLTKDEILGAKRIVGLTPEASSYGTICVHFAAAIALLRVLYAEGFQRILATLTAVGLVVMAVLSTSSSAYLGLAVLGVAYTANWIRRGLSSSAFGQRGLMGELLAGLGVICVLMFILAFRAELFDPLLRVVAEVIFNKPLSDSFYERSRWNTVAWETLAGTWGLGVGFGSTRASNWFAAISSAGLISASCMAIFLAQTFMRRPSFQAPSSAELLAGLKLSLLPSLAMAGVAFAGPDFGLWMAVSFGAIAGIAEFRPYYGTIARGAGSLKLSGVNARAPSNAHRVKLSPRHWYRDAESEKLPPRQNSF